MSNNLAKASGEILALCCTNAEDEGVSIENRLIFSNSFVSVPPPKHKMVLMVLSNESFRFLVKSLPGQLQNCDFIKSSFLMLESGYISHSGSG